MAIARLENEMLSAKISPQDFAARDALTKQFIHLPKEFFTKLRHFQPQVGCLNRCGFCSQSSGNKVWQFTESGLSNIIAAMKFAAVNKAPKSYILNKMPFNEYGTFNETFNMPKYGLITYEREYKPGVIYSYLDNDPSLYPYINKFLEMMWKDLGVKTRITTVGYSRRNTALQKAHENICNELINTVSKIVLSYTPYTFGWTKLGERTGEVSRTEFAADFENILKTYNTPITKYGGKFFSVEFKFRPLVKVVAVDECNINERHVLHAGPYLLISEHKNPDLGIAKLKEISGHSVILDRHGEVYLMFVSDGLANEKKWFDFASDVIFSMNNKRFTKISGFFSKKVEFYAIENEDGRYYSIDPMITEDGFFGKQFYIKTDKREKSGYIDTERYFLNAIIKYKHERHYSRRDTFSDATWYDVGEVIQNIKNYVEQWKKVNVDISEYINIELLPQIEVYVRCLRNAGYPPSYFFDKNFTVDTGTICNLGKAFYEFKGLVSRENIPVTPQQERAYGSLSSLSQDKKVWRISPVPLIKVEEEGKKSLIGNYNTASKKELLSIQQINLSERTSSYLDTYITKQFYIELPQNSIEVFRSLNGIPSIPGSVPVGVLSQAYSREDNVMVVSCQKK